MSHNELQSLHAVRRGVELFWVCREWTFGQAPVPNTVGYGHHLPVNISSVIYQELDETEEVPGRAISPFRLIERFKAAQPYAHITNMQEQRRKGLHIEIPSLDLFKDKPPRVRVDFRRLYEEFVLPLDRV